MDDQYTFENKTYKDTYRHTTSHILAQAMKRLYPEVKLAIGRPSRTASIMILTVPSLLRPRYLRSSRPRCARSARKSCV